MNWTWLVDILYGFYNVKTFDRSWSHSVLLRYSQILLWPFCGFFDASQSIASFHTHIKYNKKHRSPPLRKLIKVTGVLINYLHLFKSLFMLAFLVHGKCPGILIFSCITVQVGALCKYLAGSATVVMVCVMNLLLHPLWIFYFSCFINGCLSRKFWVFPYYALQYLF